MSIVHFCLAKMSTARSLTLKEHDGGKDRTRKYILWTAVNQGFS